LALSAPFGIAFDGADMGAGEILGCNDGGLRPRASDTVGGWFRPRAEHGSLAVRERE
jgi:hypothetical protein